MADIGRFVKSARKGGYGGDKTKNTNRKSPRFGLDFYTEPTPRGEIHHYPDGRSVFVSKQKAQMKPAQQGAGLDDLLTALRANPRKKR
jgi:hypothetical protein